MSDDPRDPALSSFVALRGDLLAIAQTVVGQRHIAEDLVQDSWLRWSRQSYPADQARPILARIVRNLAIDWHRRARRERDGLVLYGKAQTDHALDSERVVMARQELLLTVRALEELPERTLLAFRLSRVEGLSLKETGRRLGLSEARAHQLVRAALIHIALTLEDGE